MSTTLVCRYRGAILASLFAVVVLSGQPAGAQTTAAESTPPAMTACDFAAESSDSSEKGLAVRAAPDAAAQVLGYIPRIGDKQGLR